MSKCEECGAPEGKPHATNCSQPDFDKPLQGRPVEPPLEMVSESGAVREVKVEGAIDRGAKPEVTAVVRKPDGEVEVQGLNVLDFARAAIKSGLVPPTFKTPEAVLVAFQVGQEAGLSRMQSLSSVVVINNIPSWRGDAAHALVQNSGKLRNGTDIEVKWNGKEGSDEWECVVRAYRVNVDQPFEGRFSVKDAKLAKLWNKVGPWQQYPARMLYYRALGFCLRDGFSDVLKGLAISEEVADYAPGSARVRDVSPPHRDPPSMRDPLLPGSSSDDGDSGPEAA